MKRTCRIMILIFLLSLLLPSLPAAAEDGAATDLTRYLKVEQSGGHPNAKELLDAKLDDTIPYVQFEVVRLSWANAEQQPATLCIQWGKLPERVQLRQTDASGTVLSDEYAEPVFDAIIPLSDNAAGVTIIAGSDGMDIARFALYSEGSLPAPFFPWKETPKGMDYLLVATHPDDEVLFMGGIIPTYGAEQGYVGTVAYVTNPSRKRVNEAMLGAWELGAAYRPLFMGFQDIREVTKEHYTNRFLPESVTLALVRLFREYRPLVVFTQDLNGEYGHWQHMIVAKSVIEASRLCADPTYDDVSCAQFGTWEVKKCYVHLYEENPFVMDIRTPLQSRGGRTAYEVAKDAFRFHTSQTSGRFIVQSETDKSAMNRFGMAYGTVEAGNDVFDNIDPTLLSSYVPPATPAPSAEPTPEPTEPPTPQPTPQRTEEPTPAPTEPPTPQPTLVPVRNTDVIVSEWIVPVASALIGAAIAACAMFLILRRRRG